MIMYEFNTLVRVIIWFTVQKYVGLCAYVTRDRAEYFYVPNFDHGGRRGNVADGSPIKSSTQVRVNTSPMGLVRGVLEV